MKTEIFRTKTFITGLLTATFAIVNALTGGIIPPEAAEAIHTAGLALMGIFLRDGYSKNNGR